MGFDPIALKSCFRGLIPILGTGTPALKKKICLWPMPMAMTTAMDENPKKNNKNAIFYKNAIFSKIAPKQIYFWPYSMKGKPWPSGRTG